VAYWVANKYQIFGMYWSNRPTCASTHPVMTSMNTLLLFGPDHCILLVGAANLGTLHSMHDVVIHIICQTAFLSANIAAKHQVHREQLEILPKFHISR
jgi:hypothetical protein